MMKNVEKFKHTKENKILKANYYIIYNFKKAIFFLRKQ